MKTKLLSGIKTLAANSKACAAFKALAVMIVAGATTLAYSGAAFAANDGGADLNGVVDPIVKLINSFVNPILALVGAGGVIFCIMLGVKFATAEEPQEKEKRKHALKTAIIGFVLIFVLIVALKLSIGPLTTWMQNSTTSTTVEVTTL